MITAHLLFDGGMRSSKDDEVQRGLKRPRQRLSIPGRMVRLTVLKSPLVLNA